MELAGKVALVRATFDAPILVAMQARKVLKLSAMADGAKPTAPPISLQGFGRALDRISALFN